jgi:hypothetical protein
MKPRVKMRTYYFTIALISVMVLASCVKTDPSNIEFEGQSFELPSKVSEIQKSLGLTYGYYSGFNKGNVNSPNISIQIDGYPIFMGSDNDSEESYYDKTVVGATFEFYESPIDSVINNIEKTFGAKLSVKTIYSKNKMSLTKLIYRFLKTDDNVMIGVLEFDRSPHKEKYFKVSFYK